MPKGQRLYMASKGLARPELIFDTDGVPLMFAPTFENDYVCISYQGEEQTDMFIGSGKPAWEDVDGFNPFEEWVYFNQQVIEGCF